MGAEVRGERAGAARRQRREAIRRRGGDRETLGPIGRGDNVGTATLGAVIGAPKGEPNPCFRREGAASWMRSAISPLAVYLTIEI